MSGVAPSSLPAGKTAAKAGQPSESGAAQRKKSALWLIDEKEVFMETLRDHMGQNPQTVFKEVAERVAALGASTGRPRDKGETECRHKYDQLRRKVVERERKVNHHPPEHPESEKYRWAQSRMLGALAEEIARDHEAQAMKAAKQFRQEPVGRLFTDATCTPSAGPGYRALPHAFPSGMGLVSNMGLLGPASPMPHGAHAPMSMQQASPVTPYGMLPHGAWGMPPPVAPHDAAAWPVPHPHAADAAATGGPGSVGGDAATAYNVDSVTDGGAKSGRSRGSARSGKSKGPPVMLRLWPADPDGQRRIETSFRLRNKNPFIDLKAKPGKTVHALLSFLESKWADVEALLRPDGGPSATAPLRLRLQPFAGRGAEEGTLQPRPAAMDVVVGPAGTTSAKELDIGSLLSHVYGERAMRDAAAGGAEVRAELQYSWAPAEPVREAAGQTAPAAAGGGVLDASHMLSGYGSCATGSHRDKEDSLLNVHAAEGAAARRTGDEAHTRGGADGGRAAGAEGAVAADGGASGSMGMHNLDSNFLNDLIGGNSMSRFLRDLGGGGNTQAEQQQGGAQQGPQMDSAAQMGGFLRRVAAEKEREAKDEDPIAGGLSQGAGGVSSGAGGLSSGPGDVATPVKTRPDAQGASKRGTAVGASLNASLMQTLAKSAGGSLLDFSLSGLGLSMGGFVAPPMDSLLGAEDARAQGPPASKTDTEQGAKGTHPPRSDQGSKKRKLGSSEQPTAKKGAFSFALSAAQGGAAPPGHSVHAAGYGGGMLQFGGGGVPPATSATFPGLAGMLGSHAPYVAAHGHAPQAFGGLPHLQGHLPFPPTQAPGPAGMGMHPWGAGMPGAGFGYGFGHPPA
ncbi:unnamed protein product [Pedinophyceae sp. YPF-701]|nr:unnamed protein product [Pedinophyceae sp. YPF-701]